MRKDDLKRLRRKLEDRRKRLAGNIDNIGQESRRQSASKISVDHLADAGAESFDQEINLNIMEMEQGELRAIEEALARIDDGTYGRCDSCDKAIPIARLRANPYASLCIECKRAEEGERRG